jgi:hypothetical protein
MATAALLRRFYDNRFLNIKLNPYLFLMQNQLQTCLKAFFLLFCLFSGTASFAQIDAKINGRLVVVSNSNNNLVVKLQARAIDLTDPAKTLRLTSASFWFRYNDSIVSLAEQPVAATSAALMDGDYYYPNLANAYYTEKVVARQTKPDAIKPNSKFCLSHIVWEGWQTDAGGGYVFDGNGDVIPLANAEPVNSWTDISIVKLKILKTGTVKLKWNLIFLEDEILDDLSYAYQIDQFEDLITTVTYQTSALKIAAEGVGTSGDPYKISVKSTNTSEPYAGTAGFNVYYRSADATAATGTDKLSGAPFFWGNATIEDEAISSVSKDTVQYNRRLRYTSNDGTQAGDSWPALAAAAREALHVVFTPTAAGTSNGIKTYLETINSASFQNWDESDIHTVQVVNAYKLLGGPGGSNPLPVSLTEFSATLQKQNTVLLNWATASEKNSEAFEIERSANGREFTRIASVKGHGTTSGFNAYSTTDSNPLPGLSYYRLKQIDTDGGFTYSHIIAINRKSGANAQLPVIYPNPTTGNCALVLNLSQAENISFVLYDGLGKVVIQDTITVNAGQNILPVQTKGLPAGMYFLKLNGKAIQANLKIQKLTE